MSINIELPVSGVIINDINLPIYGTGGGDCSGLIDGTITKVDVSLLSGVTNIRDGAFENITALQSVEIPSNVTTIGANAFNGCTGVTSLSLAEGVQTIGANAFANNPITTLTIPSTVTSIGVSAFGGTQITELDMSNVHTPPTVDATSFPSTLTAIHVPYGLYDTYVSSWSAYASKIVRLPAIPSTITVTVNNYLGELVGGASVTITGNGQTYTGTTDSVGVFTQGDLQPATYTVSVADLEGFKTPASQEVVVEEDTQNSVVVTYLEKPSILLFSEATPAEISAISAEISANNMTSSQVAEAYHWNIGDTKDIKLTTGEVITMRIIGFNHDDLTEGGKAGITLEMVGCLATKYPMNSTSVSAGGYAASKMKTETLPTLKALLPQEWQDVIKLVDKKSANGGTNYSETLTLSEDLFLFAEIEIFGTTLYAQDGANEGSVYEYWNGKADADRIKKYDTDADGVADTVTDWWLRSVKSASTSDFCVVKTYGGINFNGAKTSRGVAFGFCI